MTQSDRQMARHRVMERILKRREALAEREVRIRAQVLAVAAAVLDRDRALADAERRISEAIHQLTVADSVPVHEAAGLCGLEVREVNRLRRLRVEQSATATSDAADPINP